MEIEEDLTVLEGGVNFLFDEQVIQDERLLNLETETEEIDEQLIIVDDDLESKFLEMTLFSTRAKTSPRVTFDYRSSMAVPTV